MKGFAILFVIITHLPFDFRFFSLRGLGGWGVSTFIFLSGYGLEKSYIAHGNKGFWKKRLTKTYVPFVLAMIVQLIVRLCINETQLRLLTIPSLLGVYPVNKIDGSMWFIPYIFLWYAVFFLTTVSKKPFTERVLFLMFSSIIILSVSTLSMLHFTSANYFVLTFTIGVVCANLRTDAYNIRKSIPILIVVFFFTAWFTVRYFVQSDFCLYIFYGFAPFFVLCLSKLLYTRIKPLFKTIGKHSYEIYLFENLCIRIAFTTLPNFLETKYGIEYLPAVASLILSVLLILVFSAGLSLIDKKITYAVKRKQIE